ncbi:DUF2460 domain-containing protein [Rhizobium sp. CFBP 8762]|uniref:DUF2460 domain-containing protein n=1 Tax=Rhizobium sp. CFBP 8762 TaxID=2775279 RepID=UPI0017859140|nr:DUF2460 domain-containing protein [Rhizobium sp. CFBP 8762]MBD8553171.1 DUF2460 domain-containing protein [Rhizobium sp. CFBP 8762]
MTGFHDVRFPLRLALRTSGGPVRRTDIVNLSNGGEHRNSRWRDARRHYDAGSGVRSIDDLYVVVAFFEARMGQLYGFRFRDPVDFKSCAPGEVISPFDQSIGTGDGQATGFQLVKTYSDAGGQTRREIAKPVADTVMVAVNGKRVDAFRVDPATGMVQLAIAPPVGALVQAGFEFDVPVRFDTDRIEINLAQFNAGAIPAIPLMEIQP